VVNIGTVIYLKEDEDEGRDIDIGASESGWYYAESR
jgi:hypothetical protein